MDFDPCAGPAPTATLAQCQRSGLTAAQFGTEILNNPAGQYNFLQGGNPALNPEKAKSYTLGAVFTPMRNLNASIDYWRIKVDNVIDIIPSDLAVNQCVFSGIFCDLIHRDPLLGTLWANGGFVTGLNQNLAKRKTSGVDVAVNYNQPLGAWGNLGVNFVGTWVKDFTFDVGLGEFDCAGLFGSKCGSPVPEWRHKLRGLWSTPWNVDVSATWRHIDKVDLEATSSDPQLAAPSDPVNRQLAARDYFDIAASWAITKNFTLWAGVNNVFDKDPPIISSVIADPRIFGNGNTFPQAYDALGRRIFISLTAKF
jgi:iron complex outermembrane receptor protein